MSTMIPLGDVIRILGMKPLTGEGGMWSQGYVSDETVSAGMFEGRDTDRPLYGTIYYLFTRESFSGMHRLATDEVWYHHAGPSAQLLLIYPDGASEIRLLGQDLLNGERPQVMVPRGTWMGCAMAGVGEYTLMSTSMAPAYQDSDFEAGTYEQLEQYVATKNRELLRKLTGEPVY